MVEHRETRDINVSQQETPGAKDSRRVGDIEGGRGLNSHHPN